MRLWMGAVGAVVACVVAGGLVGYAVAGPSSSGASSPFTPAPMSASPTLPVDSTPPYAPDNHYPPLSSSLLYTNATVGVGGARWSVSVPRGWVSGPSTTPYSKAWRPAGEPPGGYQLRVAPLIGDRSTIAEQMTTQTANMPAGTNVENTTGTTVWYDFRDAGNFHRYNFFTWVPRPGTDIVGLEISVTGREVDRDGLNALMQHVRASATLAPGSPRTEAPILPGSPTTTAPPASESPSTSPTPSDSPDSSSPSSMPATPSTTPPR